MTETERTALLQAFIFAGVFITAVDDELHSGEDVRWRLSLTAHRNDATKQLQAALVKLDPKMAAIMAVLEED